MCQGILAASRNVPASPRYSSTFPIFGAPNVQTCLERRIEEENVDPVRRYFPSTTQYSFVKRFRMCHCIACHNVEIERTLSSVKHDS